MKTLFSPLGVVLISILLSGCGKAPQEEFYYDDPHADFLGTRTWKSENLPLVIKVPHGLTQYEEAILKAGDRWSEALGQTVFVFEMEAFNDVLLSKTTDSLNDNFFGLFKQTFWSFDNMSNGVLAYTSTLSQGLNIMHADIIFNFDDFLFANHDYPPVGMGDNYIDFESVLVHELGHFLGLGHTNPGNDAESVMLPTLRKGEARRELSEQDIKKIRSLYLKL